MLKTMKHKLLLLDRRAKLKLANHVFFATAASLFVAHQTVLNPEEKAVEVPVVAQALNYQPQIPPPGVDPDQLTVDEIDFVNGTVP